MSAIDLDGFEATPLERDPYDYLIVPGFLKPEAIAAIDADYPRIEKAGSFPLHGLSYGAAFKALVDELQGPAIRAAFAAKFGISLEDRPTLLTVRGVCRIKDGKIHNDSTTKIITVLIYMNTEWGDQAGRLRVLRSADNLEDYAAEVPPVAGTLLAFRVCENSWHGHESFAGIRRAIQLNWVTDASVVRREGRRHGISAWMKSLFNAA